MRAHEILTEEQLNELDWRKGLATGAMALGALGAMGSAQARVTPDHDPSINRLTGKPNVTQVAPTQQPSAQMPNQNLDSAEKVERSADGIVVHYGGKEYQGVEVSKDGPTPRGAKMIKIQQAQMGERGIGNYTTYLLPSGKAYIYSK